MKNATCGFDRNLRVLKPRFKVGPAGGVNSTVPSARVQNVQEQENLEAGSKIRTRKVHIQAYSTPHHNERDRVERRFTIATAQFLVRSQDFKLKLKSHGVIAAGAVRIRSRIT